MTTLRNTPLAWGTIAKLFHWIGALFVLLLIADGWWMTHLVERAGRLQQYQLHSAIGYYLLLFIALRFLWREINPVPALPQELAAWEQGAALAAHWLLYVLMIGVSISGWLLAGSLARPIEATLFGFTPVPNPLGASAGRELHEVLEETHHVLSYTLLALIVFHVASALRHHFWKKNDVLRRMWWRS